MQDKLLPSSDFPASLVRTASKR